jgi:hypothetical protein
VGADYYPDFQNPKIRIRVITFLVKSMKKVPFLWVLTITRIFRIRIRVITFLVKSVKKVTFLWGT